MKEGIQAERSRERAKAWYHKNKARALARVKARSERIKTADPEGWKLMNQRHANRYLAGLKSNVHQDLDTVRELALFSECQRMTKETGVVHHVDHIIPLVAGGWHHHLNMQVLPADVNRSKHADPFWEMVGFKSWRDVPRHLWPEKLVPSYLALLADS